MADPAKQPETAVTDVQGLAQAVVELVVAQYPDMRWPESDEALNLAKHLLKLRAQVYSPPPA